MKNSKRVKLKELLAERITKGEFSFGDRFPGLHQLCKEYGISYVTVNKAMKMLVKEGYLLAKNGVGYSVCYVQPNVVSTKKIVNFITKLTSSNPVWPVIENGKKLFEQAGWEVNIYTIPDGDLSGCVPLLNSPDAYSVLFFTRVNWENFSATFGHISKRVIVIGQLSGNTDITSIISDEYETVRRCVEYFRSTNHHRTGLISYASNKELEMLRIAAWRSIMIADGTPRRELDQLCFAFDPNNIPKDDQAIKEAFKSWLLKIKGKIDSVIVPYAPTTFAEVCKESGLKIPEDISIIAISGCSSASSNPPIPIIDNDLPKHFEYAFNILEDRFKTGSNSPGAWNFCPPGKLILKKN